MAIFWKGYFGHEMRAVFTREDNDPLRRTMSDEELPTGVI